MPINIIDGMKPCSDTVDLGSSLGRQKQSTKKNPPAFSFGSTKREAASKASLSHEEVLKMPTTLFQPHMVRPPAKRTYPFTLLVINQ